MSKLVKFCPKKLLDAFRKAKEGNQIIIDEYVCGYNGADPLF